MVIYFDQKKRGVLFKKKKTVSSLSSKGIRSSMGSFHPCILSSDKTQTFCDNFVAM